MTADCYSYPIPAILIMSGISLRVSTHLSFHADPTAISYLQVIPLVGTGKQLVHANMPSIRRARRCVPCCSSLVTSKDTSPRVERVCRIWNRAIAPGENPSGLPRASYPTDRVCAPPPADPRRLPTPLAAPLPCATLAVVSLLRSAGLFYGNAPTADVDGA